jgi:hypothetical protein
MRGAVCHLVGLPSVGLLVRHGSVGLVGWLVVRHALRRSGGVACVLIGLLRSVALLLLARMVLVRMHGG